MSELKRTVYADLPNSANVVDGKPKYAPATEWYVAPENNGLYVRLFSSKGHDIWCSRREDATTLCLILRSLEESAAFGQQCYQDRCENAYVEASVVKALEAGTTIAIGALKNLWCEVYHTQRRGESAEEARERSIGEMLTDTGITREQFDEWKVSKPDSKGAADGDGK